MDNIQPGADGQANHTISVLRAEAREDKLTSDVQFLPGFSFHADPALQISGSYKSVEGQVIELNAKAGSDDGEWAALHLGIPARNLSHTGVVGFVARVVAPEIVVARACLRSATPDGFVDSFFDKHILFRPEEATHMDVLQVPYRDDVPDHAEWRELILFLPATDFSLSVIDLRVFAV